ncbi:hypothetical protein D3C80_1111490 [compost metagenome]
MPSCAIRTQRCCTLNSTPASLTALSRRSPVSRAVVLSAFLILMSLKPEPTAVHGPGRLNGHGRITQRGFFTTWWLPTVSALVTGLLRLTSINGRCIRWLSIAISRYRTAKAEAVPNHGIPATSISRTVTTLTLCCVIFPLSSAA